MNLDELQGFDGLEDSAKWQVSPIHDMFKIISKAPLSIGTEFFTINND